MSSIKDATTGKSFLGIRMASMVPNKPTSFDLYVMINGKFILYLHGGDHLTEEKIENLNSKKTDKFFIEEKDLKAFKEYIHDRVTDDTMNSKQKALVLKESSYALIEELFENPDVGKAMEDAKEIVNHFMDLMDQDSAAVANLISLSSHDFYTYNHSLDVSIYSIGLGRVLGYIDKDLVELGRGALYHDIGKRMVDLSIITKNGPLDDNEWEQMKQHPIYGLKILDEVGGFSEAIKACVFEHHENFLGTGYPQALDGDEIHPMARVVAITDCYDALTTQRSYNEPMMPSAALDFMMEKLIKKFDPDILRAMHSVLFQVKAS